MSRFIAFGILRRDFQVLATGEDEAEVNSIAEDSVRRGLVTEAFVLSADTAFVQGVVEPIEPPAPAKEVPPPPLNLNNHPEGLSTDQVLGGQFMRDVHEGDGADGSADIDGRADPEGNTTGADNTIRSADAPKVSTDSKAAKQ